METSSFDVAVIGGGPAGMISAGRAAELGARVILLEKNASPGRKLLLTGGGRCNILHAEEDVHRLVAHYGSKGKALYSAFSQFDATATSRFFEARGLPIKVEEEQRAFPVSDSAEDVRQTLLRYLEEGNVIVRTSTIVLGMEAQEGSIRNILLQDGETIAARAFILATGGMSRPETGSTGDGFAWMRDLGHTIVPPDPALVPVALGDRWIADVAGIALTDVCLTVFQNGVKHDTKKGKLLFTHEGISGPLVLNMSKGIGALLKTGAVTLSLDLFPSFDLGALDHFLLEQFEGEKRKMIRNALVGIVPPRLGLVILALAGIPSEISVSSLTREQRLAFARLLKELPMTVAGLLVQKAVVTGGGVALGEVNFRTMQSKLFPNLFFAGDILDFDRPSGGFSLQICWTTGYVAGEHAAFS